MKKIKLLNFNKPKIILLSIKYLIYLIDIVYIYNSCLIKTRIFKVIKVYHDCSIN